MSGNKNFSDRAVIVSIMDKQEQTLQKSARLKIVIIILAVLLVLSAGGLAARYIYFTYFAPAQSTVTVPENLIGKDTQPGETSAPAGSDAKSPASAVGNVSAEQSFTSEPGSISAASLPVQTDKPQAPKLELYEGKPGVNQQFEVRNLFPGDSVTKYFCVKAYHDADISLYFRADVTEQTKALSDALHMKVTHMESGKVLCDAPFSKIDGKEFSELLKANEDKSTAAYYQIDVSLDTSVGNEYQAAILKADLNWNVKDEGGLISPPQTGDSFNLLLWVTLAASSLLMMIFLWKRRKEDKRHGSTE